MLFLASKFRNLTKPSRNTLFRNWLKLQPTLGAGIAALCCPDFSASLRPRYQPDCQSSFSGIPTIVFSPDPRAVQEAYGTGYTFFFNYEESAQQLCALLDNMSTKDFLPDLKKRFSTRRIASNICRWFIVHYLSCKFCRKFNNRFFLFCVIIYIHKLQGIMTSQPNIWFILMFQVLLFQIFPSEKFYAVSWLPSPVIKRAE